MLGRMHVSDKMLHFAGYALLAMLPAIHERLRAVAGATFGLVGLGIIVEFTQLESGWGRMFELRDIAANSLGVGVGLIAGLVMRA